MKTYLTISFVLILLIGASAPIHGITAPFDDSPRASNSLIMSSDQNNVTMSVDGTKLLFLGEDVWAKAEQYFPGLTDNDTVLNLMNKYSDELLFITRTYSSGYVTVVAMNESMYVELLIKCTFEYNFISGVNAIEEMNSSTYHDSLSNVLSTIMTENVTRNLKLISWEQCSPVSYSPVKTYLWSYNFDGKTLNFADNPSAVLYLSPDADNLLSQVHWEIVTAGYMTQRVSAGCANFGIWEYEEVLSTMVLSVSQSGEIIQILSKVLPVDDSNTATIIIVLVVGVVSFVALIAIFYRRR